MKIENLGNGVYRGSQPTRPEDFEILRQIGISMVIDLENEPGEALWEHTQWLPMEMAFWAVPLSTFAAPERDRIQSVLDVINTVRKGGTFFHCRHGEDRTGLVAGLYLMRKNGWSKWTAWRYMLSTHFHPFLIGLTWRFWTW